MLDLLNLCVSVYLLFLEGVSEGPGGFRKLRHPGGTSGRLVLPQSGTVPSKGPLKVTCIKIRSDAKVSTSLTIFLTKF